MTKEKKRVLVCGASGFLGRNIFESLQKIGNLEVRGTIFTQQWKFGGVAGMDFANFMREEDCLEHTRNVDTVIQCAALTAGSQRKGDWVFFASENIKMNQNLIGAAVANSVKHFIFLSCSVMYPVNLGRPVREEEVSEEKIHKDYFAGAEAKLIVETLMKMCARSSFTNFASIRHSNIYGPYDKFDLKNSHVMAATIEKTMTAKGETIYMLGGENTVRDLLYVSDLVDFVEKLVVFGSGEKFMVYNVGAGRGVSVGTLADKVVKISGKDLTVVFEREENPEPTSIVLDTKKARIFTGWEPKVSLDEGIKKTIEWYRANKGE